MKTLIHEIAVLGGGPAGYSAAVYASGLGADVVLIEDKDYGGTCLNAGCIPTKSLLATADLKRNLDNAKDFGLFSEPMDLDWKLAFSRKDKTVRNLAQGLEYLLTTRKINLIKGRGNAVSAHEVIVSTIEGEVSIRCKKMILATGASPMILPIPGAELPGVLTSNSILNLETLPASLAIIGAGTIGLEIASIFSTVGVDVVLFDSKDGLLQSEDKDIGHEFLKILTRRGMRFSFNSEIERIEQSKDGLMIVCNSSGIERSLMAENILFAIGCKPDLDSVSALDLAISDGGIKVNERMETSVPGVYAAGDVTGGHFMAHLAFAEGRIAAENAMGCNRCMDYQAIPVCIYTNPEYASVGLTKSQAEAKGIIPRIGTFHFKNNGRALTLQEHEGLVKVVADEAGVILGAQILGAHASELITEITLAVKAKINADFIADTISPHPTLSEVIWEACAEVAGKSLHKI